MKYQTTPLSLIVVRTNRCIECFLWNQNAVECWFSLCCWL